MFLVDNLISWSSECQHTVSCSSAKVEYHGDANVVAETTWLCSLLWELHYPRRSITLVCCDNVSLIYMLANLVQTSTDITHWASYPFCLGQSWYCLYTYFICSFKISVCCHLHKGITLSSLLRVQIQFDCSSTYHLDCDCILVCMYDIVYILRLSTSCCILSQPILLYHGYMFFVMHSKSSLQGSCTM